MSGWRVVGVGGMREKGGTRQRENCCGVELRAKEGLCGRSQHGAADEDNDDGVSKKKCTSDN